MADKEEKGRGRATRSGSVVAASPELTEWLNLLWARSEPPDRLEVWQMFGRNKAIRGEMIHHVDFKPNSKMDIEQINRLVNEIVAVAQNDCDAAERKSSYQIAMTDRNRGAGQLVRRYGPIFPKRRAQLVGYGSGVEEEDDEDGAQLNGNTLALQYIKEANEQVRWDRQRYDTVMGGLLVMQQNIIQEQRKFVDDMSRRQMEMFAQVQEAKDREADRVVARKMAEFKVTLLEDGLRTARNLIPALFQKSATGQDDSSGQASARRDHGFSPERVLVDNLLTDCEKTGISTKLFGDWDVVEGKPKLVSEAGIFTPQQLAILLGVQSGSLPASALDALLPDSKDPRAITQEQIMRAQPLMTEGTGTALLQIIGLRRPSQGTDKSN